MEEKETLKNLSENLNKAEQLREKIVQLNTTLELGNYEQKTRKGKIVLELNTMKTDLHHKDVDAVTFFKEKLGLHMQELVKQGEQKSIPELQKINVNEILKNQKEINWLDQTRKEIEIETRGKGYQHLVEKYDGYVKGLISWGDTETAKRLQELRRYIVDEEGKHLEEIRKQIDNIGTTTAAEFSQKLKAYFALLEKENDNKLITQIKKSELIKFLLNFDKAKEIFNELTKTITYSLRTENWKRFIEIFYRHGKIKTLDAEGKNEIQKYIDELNKLGDKPSANLLKIIRVRERAKHIPEGKYPSWFEIGKEGMTPENVNKLLIGWSQRMNSGEYLKKIEENSTQNIDKIILKREQELAKIRAEKIRELVKVLTSRQERVEQQKQKEIEKTIKVISDREEELKVEYEQIKIEFSKELVGLVNEINDMTNEKVNAEGELACTLIEEKEGKIVQKLEESKGMSQKLMDQIQKMVKNPITEADIKELIRIRIEIFTKSKEVIELQEAMIPDERKVRLVSKKQITLLEQIIKKQPEAIKKIEEIENKIGMTKETGPTETFAEEEEPMRMAA